MNAVLGRGTTLAIAAFLAVGATSAALYENDFSTRTSESAPRSVWAEYEYDKGGPLAFDYDHVSAFNPLTEIYSWSTSTSYTQQDGWFKKNRGSGARRINRGRTTVTDEADPALIHSAKQLYSDVPVTNIDIVVMHPLHNVFTNGVIKWQFDIRQPTAPTSPMFSWLRLETEYCMKNDNTTHAQIPLELGLSSTTFSGGWRNDGDVDGKRTFHSYTARRPGGGYWYRYYVTSDLDTFRSSFEVYELGDSRISMDAMPSGTPIWSGSNLLFVNELTPSTGGISGIGIRFAKLVTDAYYGETGFDESRAYMYDNIKVAWKAPSAQSFEECYRNDFAKSMRRTIDGSDSTSHAYTLSEQTESSTFTYPAELVRASNIGNITGKPYLPAAFGTANTVHTPSVDGWRFCGMSGYTGPIVLTTNGANRIGMLTKNCAVIQPMCEDITNGLVKMEWDMRMPKGWNGNYGRSSIILTSRHGYDNEYELCNWRLLSLGFCSTNGKADKTTPLTTYSIMSSNAGYLSASWHAEWGEFFTPNEWYRFQLFIDMDKTNYWFNVYDVGAAAPATPDSFDTSTATVLVSSSSKQPLFTNGINRDGLALGACGFLSWNIPDSDVGYALLVDNIRLWKGDGNDGWDLVFKNDFSTTTRCFKRKSLKMMKTNYIDRPEYGEDGWSAMPTYVGAPRIAGENPALYSGDEIFSMVQPIGRHVRSGKLYAQYDVRVPVFWTSRMNYFWFQLGNGALASASTWTSPFYRFQNHRTIRTGMQVSKNGSVENSDDKTGVRNKTAIILQDGTGVGGDGSTKTKHIDGAYVGHWIRMKIDADMSAKTWNCTAYDMGTVQPTFATADGTQLESWSNLHFNFNEPISHIHIIGGRAPSYMPWRGDAPGALLVDNIRIRHSPPGTTVFLR